MEEGNMKWDDLVEEISFNLAEDSKELYPHFQYRISLPLREAVEVMIACHDSYVAKSIVSFCGGWGKVNKSIQSYYSTINVTEDPRDNDNKAQLEQALDLMVDVFQGYQREPPLWTPIINGLIRQKGNIDGIPMHHLNHRTGCLESVVVDIGLIGDFNEDPFIFAVGATHLPNRFGDQVADFKILEAMGLLYKEYEKK
ncbi:class A beta-lactamase-related serine hydrolase [Bacillus sp. CH30_1T]|uniref:class A beta-lactamase-related serine hydrolase n=1 Tax=Bacillus sp. CH30_1T TaxID=2604836 RepID=UPI0021CDB2A6|nr:class A beta-lactamase-related serine hydrolase [Bacillus sp. CH30_1T]